MTQYQLRASICIHPCATIPTHLKAHIDVCTWTYKEKRERMNLKAALKERSRSDELCMEKCRTDLSVNLRFFVVVAVVLKSKYCSINSLTTHWQNVKYSLGQEGQTSADEMLFGGDTKAMVTGEEHLGVRKGLTLRTIKLECAQNS